VRELVLENNPEVSVEGFGSIEKHQAAWRWAHGAQQSLSFFTKSKRCRIRYQLFLPLKGTELRIRLNENEWRIISEQEEQRFTGELNFLSANHANKIDFFAILPHPNPVDPILSFSVESFILLELDLAPIKAERFQSLKEGGEPDFFCSVPFLQLMVSESGISYPCCDTIQPLQRPEIALDMNFQKIETEADFLAAWNSDSVRRIRTEILSGRKPPMCEKCVHLEQGGAQSLRNAFAKHKKAALRAALECSPIGEMAIAPRHLDIRLGNLCNLKCRMCGPKSSVLMVDDFEEIFEKSYAADRKMDWHKGEAFLNALANSCAGIELLTLSGGESFLIPEMPKFLRLLKSKGFAKRIELQLITNATVLDQNLLDCFSDFKAVHLIVSLDGTKEVNEYIRYPSNFAKIEENLQFLHEGMERLSVTSLRFNTTVQAMNLLGLPDLFEFTAQFSKFQRVPTLSVLTSPEEFSVLVLPLSLRAQAIERLQKALSSLPLGEQEGALGLMDYLRKGEDRSWLLPKFRRYNEILTKRRPNAKKIPAQELAGIFN
jgi:sulfatase maturation enzyme AslB (radical SAM superfamily)